MVKKDYLSDFVLQGGDPSPSILSGDRAPMSPMMEQYIEIKIANPGMLLFYRMGDFYELFFEDAEKASAALGIVLTKRGQYKGEDIPMCGVPAHTADDYLQKLIDLGFSVAVCEQVETPAEAKKRTGKSLVRRDVVRLVTPGTLTEEKLLKPFESNFFMAVSCIKERDTFIFALAWLDISVGDFHVVEVPFDLVYAEMTRINPREIIVADSVFSNPIFRSLFDPLGKIVSPMADAMFDSSVATDRILRLYKVKTLEGFGSFSSCELSAICGAIAYLEKTQKYELPSISPPHKKRIDSYLYIDPATRINLELLQTTSGNRKGSLLHAMNCTLTNVGARLLAERLIAPLLDIGEIQQRLDSVDFFVKKRQLCDRIRSYIKGAADMPRALSRLALNRGGPRDLGSLSATFQTVQRLLDLQKEETFPAGIAEIFSIFSTLPQEYAARLNNALFDPLPILRRDGGFIKTGYNKELDEMRTLRDQSKKIVSQMEANFILETGIKSLKIRHNHILGHYIEVGAQHHSSMDSSRFIHRQTMVNAMRFTTKELIDLEKKIAEAAENVLNMEISFFDSFVSEAVSYSEIIRQISNAIATLDVSCSLAVLAVEQNLCRPMVDDSLSFKVLGGRHLVVEQALVLDSSSPFVSNHCDLSPSNPHDKGAIWLLTGPNMGGKSTFLRQNALIVLMAQMGSFVPAQSAHIGVVNQIFSRVGASDDLARGRSTFMVEMIETAVILNQAGERALVILDEIGRGTSTFDGLSIAWASLEYLHDKNQCRTIFATHFQEMSVLCTKLARLKNVTMRVKEWQGEVIFLHEVGEGIADRSYGIQVARLAGLPESVLCRAQNILFHLEKDKVAQKDFESGFPLFEKVIGTELKKPQQENFAHTNLMKALDNLNPDQLSPREALEALYHLKEIRIKET